MPSELHTDLTARALCWLSNISTGKGIRSCPEMPIGVGYVADAGAIMNLQMKWAYDFFEGNYYSDIRDKNGWPETDDFSIVVEAKAYRSDFQKTFFRNGHAGDRLVPAANFHFLVVAKGVCSPHEVPEFWGVLEQSRNGVKLIKKPSYCPKSLPHLHEFGYRILRYSSKWKFSVMGLQEKQTTLF